MPFAVPPLLTSRHSAGKRTLLTVPLPLNVHCWLVPPLQSQICTRVPLAALGGDVEALAEDAQGLAVLA